MIMGENTSEKEEKKSIKSSAKLLQKWKTLEKEFQNFIQTSSITKKCNTFDNLVEFDSCPKNLMTALQQHPTTTTRNERSLSFSYCSPSSIISGSSGEVWRVRDNELAIEEVIRRDRKLGFETGRLRGRRLFEDDSDLSYDGEDVHSVCDEISEVKEVNEEFREVGDVKSHGIGKLMLIIVVLFVFVLVCFVFLGRFDEHVSEVKMAVIPT